MGNLGGNMEYEISPKGNIGIKKCGGNILTLLFQCVIIQAKKGEYNGNRIYVLENDLWLFYKDEFNLSNGIIKDAKTINHIKYLWKCASKEYLKNQDIDDMVEMWTNLNFYNKKHIKNVMISFALI